MGRVLVCGGGLIGLLTAVLLADDGHEVTVLERDRGAPPTGADVAWTSWQRRGVPQFRQPHNLFPLFQRVLDADLPEVSTRLLEAGCVWRDPLTGMPPSVTDRTPRPGDERFRFLTGRRPVVEAVVAQLAVEHPRVTVHRGVVAEGLLVEEGAVPHVVGVRDRSGTEHRADLVLDAMGRSSPVADWLGALGSPPAVEGGDRGFAYYSRYYSGDLPEPRAPGLSAIGSISVLTIAGDSRTWSVTLFGTTADRALRGARDPERFEDVVRACPQHAHWLDGRAITEVLPMAGNVDKRRRYVVDGRPVVTGLLPVADAWACTNPSAGRGLSVGLVHAQRLRDLLRTRELTDPELPLVWDDDTELHVAKWWYAQEASDAFRIAEMDAYRQGAAPPEPHPGLRRLLAAAVVDADAFRGLVDVGCSVEVLPDVLTRPDLQVPLQRHGDGPAPVVAGPDRGQLEQLLTG